MKIFEVEHIAEAISEVEANAAEMKLSAAYSGAMNDGGASALMEKLKIFKIMWDGKPLPESRVPQFIKSVLIEVEQSYDPEYQKYLELKAKFESK
jgi:hypothetical protein